MFFSILIYLFIYIYIFISMQGHLQVCQIQECVGGQLYIAMTDSSSFLSRTELRKVSVGGPHGTSTTAV